MKGQGWVGQDHNTSKNMISNKKTMNTTWNELTFSFA
jgi:hypothetical protein